MLCLPIGARRRSATRLDRLVLELGQGTVLTVVLVVSRSTRSTSSTGWTGWPPASSASRRSAFFVLLLPSSPSARASTRATAARAVIAAALIGVCLGFLPHNFNPARIFMGDSGSMLIGLLLAATDDHPDRHGRPQRRSTADLAARPAAAAAAARGDGGPARRPAARRRPPHARRPVAVRAGQAAPAPPAAGDRATRHAPRRAAHVPLVGADRLRRGRGRLPDAMRAGRQPGRRARRSSRSLRHDEHPAAAPAPRARSPACGAGRPDDGTAGGPVGARALLGPGRPGRAGRRRSLRGRRLRSSPGAPGAGGRGGSGGRRSSLRLPAASGQRADRAGRGRGAPRRSAAGAAAARSTSAQVLAAGRGARGRSSTSDALGPRRCSGLDASSPWRAGAGPPARCGRWLRCAAPVVDVEPAAGRPAQPERRADRVLPRDASDDRAGRRPRAGDDAGAEVRLARSPEPLRCARSTRGRSSATCSPA